MKKTLSGTVAALLAVTGCGAPGALLNAAASRLPVAVGYQNERQLSFNDGWQFNLGDVSGASASSYDDSAWGNVTLPHDWSISLPFNQNSAAGGTGGYLDGGTGWYRKTFTLPQSMAGKKVSILFDGVYMNSTVWVNGTQIGTHHYGYTPFEYDLTSCLNFGGTNVIAVKVVNNQPTSRWYSGSGINRNVWLNVTGDVHIPTNGTYVTTPQITGSGSSVTATVSVATTVANSGGSADVTLSSTVLDSAGNPVASLQTASTAAAGASVKIPQTLTVTNAKLWSPDSPTLYTLKSEVSVGGTVVDTVLTPFGIRSLRFDPNEGFFINGVSTKLHGVCLHTDEGSLGNVVNIDAMTRKLTILKQMGCNAIRTSHNPPSAEFLDLCDRMGFLVMDEAFDCWNAGKVTNDYHLYFATDAQSDLQAMVNRDKNHPSIILWSVGNEIADTTWDNAPTVAQNLINWVQAIDSTRPVTTAENKMGDSSLQKVADLLGAVGYNYGEQYYDAEHAANPGWCIFGSEVSSAVRSRGVYKTPVDQNILSSDDNQCSSYDNSVVPWGRSAESSWIADRDRKFVMGEFIWTGFDYLGEPTPYGWPSRSSYFGIVDTAGFPKDIYYFYQSQWTTTPMVHLLPSWNGTEGQVMPVMAYTNAASVELFLNGKSLGVQQYDPNGSTLHLLWNVKFTPGTLTAVARDKNGNVVATDTSRTAGLPAKISLKQEKSVVTADGKSLVYIDADVQDIDGNFVASAADQINFHVTGGTVVGVDNGDATDVTSFQGSTKKAFSGKCLAIVKADSSVGQITVTADSSTLPLGSNTVTVYKQAAISGAPGSLLGYQQPATVYTAVGSAPSLPADVQAVYTDGGTQALAVSWQSVSPASYAQAGSFTVNGTVNATGGTVSCTVQALAADFSSISPISLVTLKGTPPALPANVTVSFANGTKAIRDVAWDAVDPASYQQAGSFTVGGGIAGTSERVQADVTVKDIASIDPVVCVTQLGTAPTLPDTVTIHYTDGAASSVPVEWDLSSAAYDSPGTVLVSGVFAGGSYPVSARVTVSPNYALKASGASYPQGIASFTCSGDSVGQLNDGVISYSYNSPKNRWTDWDNTWRSGDWFGIDFGQSISISTIKLYVYQDSGCVPPSTLAVQYDDGTGWKDVTNPAFDGTKTVTGLNTLSFDAVTASRVRVVVTNLQNYFTGITEMEVYGPSLPDKTALSSAVSSAASLQQSDYTAASWQAFETAYTAAASLATGNLGTTASVAAALQALTDAQAALVPAGTPDFLRGIAPGATAAQITQKLYADGTVPNGTAVTVMNQQGAILPENAVVGTGMTVTAGGFSFVIVVTGDLTGDGLANASDLLLLKRRILGLQQLQDAALKAANTDGDAADNVGSTDLLKLKRYILGLDTLS